MFEGDGDGGFARGGEAGEPYCQALLAAEGAADFGCQGSWVEGDVAVDDVISIYDLEICNVLEPVSTEVRGLHACQNEA